MISTVCSGAASFTLAGALDCDPWCERDSAENGLGTILKQPVEVRFEFSRLEPGAFVPPHTDRVGKLVRLLLYFPSPDWKEGYGGATEFYRPKRADLEDNWENRRVAFEELAPFKFISFEPKRLVGFLKSKNSYHGVQPILCPPGTARTSFKHQSELCPAEGNGKGCLRYQTRGQGNKRHFPAALNSSGGTFEYGKSPWANRDTAGNGG